MSSLRLSSQINSSQHTPVVQSFITRLIRVTPLYLGIMVMVLNDWRIGQFSFSDLFVIVGIALLFFSVSKIPSRWIIACSGLLLFIMINIFIASSENTYLLTTGIAHLIKVGLYILFYVLLYNNIKQHNMAVEFLNALINVAVVVSLIGIYIGVVIATHSNLPFSFLWAFTRQDIASYIFAGGYSNIVRVRSIFSEPQHLGLFLNITLASTLLGNYFKQINRPISISIIALAALTTFSFSTIPVLIAILFFSFVKRYGRSFFSIKNIVIIVSVTTILGALLWQPINETIFQRGSLIVSGEDGSAAQRLNESWSYVNKNNFLLGSGVGRSPYGWNNYAYLLTDFGILGLVLGLGVTYALIKRNTLIGLFFIVFCFQKGGYLSGFFLLMLLILFIATSSGTEVNKASSSSSKIKKLVR